MIKIGFPSLSERTRVETLGQFNKLYDNNAYDVLGLHAKIKKQYKKLEDLVYLAHAIPARVSDFYADFVRGDEERLTFAAPDIENKETIQAFIDATVYESDLVESVYDFANTQSKSGYVVLLGRVDEDGVYVIDEVQPDQYFPQTDGSVIFATYKYDPDDKTHKRLLLYTQHYQVVNGSVLIEREAFRTNTLGESTEKIPLSMISAIVGRELQESETIDNLDELPIRQADNGKRTKWGYGKSDYFDIMPQLAEINERSTHISTVFLKNLDAKLAIPKSTMPLSGEIDATKEETYAVTKEDIVPQYVLNNMPLIADAREHIMSEAKFISFITGVPMFEILKSAMPDRVESLRIQLFSAIRRTNTKRSKLTRALKDMFRIGAKMQNIEMKQDIKISYSDVIPTDDLIEAQVEQTKVTSGLSSKRSAIMRLENIDEETAQKELDQIREEDQIAGLGGSGNFGA